MLITKSLASRKGNEIGKPEMKKRLLFSEVNPEKAKVKDDSGVQ